MFVNEGTDRNTVEFLKKSQEYDSDAFEKRQLTIAGHPATLDKIEKMLAYMEILGNIGHSTDFKVGVDGDGGFTVRITEHGGTTLSKKWGDEITSPRGEDIKSFNFD